MIISRRKYYCEYFLTMMIVGVLLIVSALMINSYFYHNDLINRIILYAIITEIFLITTVITILIVKYKSVRNLVRYFRLLSYTEKNLISIGAYTKRNDRVFVKLPRIRITQDKIIISLNTLKIRDVLEKHLNSFSTAIPEQFIVEDYYITQNNAEVVIKYADLKNFQPEQYTITEYVDLTKQIDDLSLYLDKKHIVRLTDYPHLLISGSSGSGKTYLANQIVVQGIVKEWQVVILDVKRSYGLYKKYTEYYYEPDDILKKLLEIESEMRSRLKTLELALDNNPRALAVDIGYKPILVLIEEYISLQSALDKKKREELERVVKSISVLSRQASIHLLMVMQSAGTENINATTRSNLSKILLGNAQSNILASTFGTGVDMPSIHSRIEKGEGLIQLDRITILRVPQVDDLESFNDVMAEAP